MILFILFIFLVFVSALGIAVAISNPDDPEICGVVFMFIGLTIGVFFGWRYDTVSETSTTNNIIKVERRYDGSTYAYGTNEVTGKLVSKRIPNGVDLLTDEQLLEVCEIVWTERTRRNGKTYTTQKLNY